jgi:hypothetical protein
MDNDKLEPIAIVGINLKFPGDAISAEAFWNMLCEKRCSVGRVPADRFNVDGMPTHSLRFVLVHCPTNALVGHFQADGRKQLFTTQIQPGQTVYVSHSSFL